MNSPISAPPRSPRVLVVGAGFSGAVVARMLASEADLAVEVVDERDHLAGNCHTRRDASTGILIHEYGPHIFNTSRLDVWDFVNRFGEFGPYINRVKAISGNGAYSLPINLHTINQFFGKTFRPDEAREFLASRADSSITAPRNFAEQALSMIGRELYEAFFLHYTRKQWGCDPTELPASILKRLPVRFNYNDNYYATRYQGIPVEGYTELVRRILDHGNIGVTLGHRFNCGDAQGYDWVIYSGQIDRYFDYAMGRLRYRTVFWEREDGDGDLLGNAVVNYTCGEVPFTRVHEHKHFAPWEEHEKSCIFTEYSKATEEQDIPYYPLRLAEDKERLEAYLRAADGLDNVYFLGRLATYRYLNMDQVIGEALDFAAQLLSWLSGRSNQKPATLTAR